MFAINIHNINFKRGFTSTSLFFFYSINYSQTHTIHKRNFHRSRQRIIIIKNSGRGYANRIKRKAIISLRDVVAFDHGRLCSFLHMYTRVCELYIRHVCICVCMWICIRIISAIYKLFLLDTNRSSDGDFK